MKWIKTIGLTLFAAILMSGCATESSVEKVDGKEPAETETADKKEEKTKESFTLGDTVSFDKLNITLTSARVLPGDEFFTAENDKFLAVELNIENTGEKSAAISTIMNMSLMTSDGYQQDQAIAADGKGSLDGELGAGRSMKGEIVFDVTESEYYEFIFDDPFTNGQAIWKIEKNQIKK
ncbi:DUF4352 domain-containing protein [Thalassobacillus pellis]|uniref:DUF4352 domain-containing protein n=1 Tax=Thalassobacillus pellis TaxID=748008 RepID=UPI001960F2DD|nr:DUF4352 domain-containing protein [Thalassobacillus pellis]MBM7552111.1 hypothetical protein [Thalassobacillus pellis]